MVWGNFYTIPVIFHQVSRITLTLGITHLKSTADVEVYAIYVKRILIKMQTIYTIADALFRHFKATEWKLPF